MEFHHFTEPPLEAELDLLAIAVHTDPLSDPLVKALNRDLDDALAEQAGDEDFAGRAGQSLVLASRGDLPARYVALVGAGEKDGFPVSKVREVSAHAARLGRRLGARAVGFVVPAISSRSHERAVQFAVEGALLGTYRFDRYKGENGKKPNPVKNYYIGTDRRAGGQKKQPTAAKKRSLRQAIRRGKAVARAVCHARDLVNEPAGVMTPVQLAAEARTLARKRGLTAKILTPKECEKLGMRMMLAVGQGSAQEPRLIHLTYRPKGKPKKRIALVGKGVTFDSGGYSLKPSAGMEDMKLDMSGAATVVAAMGALADLGCKHEVHAIAPCVENMVSGAAYRLGDVLRAMDGTTVEVNNTDAEGRLALGDAIAYTRQKVKPDEMFDFATLTGACLVALGPYTGGVFSEDEELIKSWVGAAEAAGEEVWRLPLSTRLRDQLKSNVADMRNTGERFGGAITAGLFLKHFVKDTPWVHNDIAGPAMVNRDGVATPKGGTGFGVATLLEYLTR